MSRPISNLDDLQFEPWDKDFPNNDRPPAAYGARKAAIGARIGAKKLGYNVTAILPGKRAYPRHAHRVNEEAFLILDGEGELRVGNERWPVRKGDVVACPPGGPETAHQFVNTSTTGDLRIFAVSTLESTEIIEYPDSAKVGYGGMFPGPDGKPQFVRGLARRGQDPGYWEDE
jgi:uncharacterized cupin superfamily protein